MSKLESIDMRNTTLRGKWSQLRSQQRLISSDWVNAPYPSEEHRVYHTGNTTIHGATGEQSTPVKDNEFKRLLH